MVVVEMIVVVVVDRVRVVLDMGMVVRICLHPIRLYLNVSLPRPAHSWTDVDCVLSASPVASECTQNCGTLTNMISVSQSGQGDACPALTTYACQPGDGGCPAGGSHT